MFEDLVQCTCMLARDGLDYVFNHRSFQEYFVAYFFARIKVEEFERVAPRLMVRLMDNVFLMMSEMNKEKFEESWALPQLNSLCEITKEIDPAANPIGFVRALVKNSNISVFIYENGIGLDVRSSKYDDVTATNTRFMLYRIYGVPERLRELYRATDDKLVLKKIREAEILKNDKRFCEYRTAGLAYKNKRIPITEADTEWFKETSHCQYFVHEKKELFRLRAEVSERVEKRKMGLASILDF
jgi:hypothetical protein